MQACQHGSHRYLPTFVILITPEYRIKKNTRGKAEKREGKRGGERRRSKEAGMLSRELASEVGWNMTQT